MSIITTYVCDHCKFESTDSTKFRNLGVAITSALQPLNKPTSYSLTLKALWCDVCVNAKHQILPSTIEPDVIVPTQAEKLYNFVEDIVADMVNDNLGSR